MMISRMFMLGMVKLWTLRPIAVKPITTLVQAA